MARRSTIDRLPAELREEIGKLRRDGCTIDEIIERLRQAPAGAQISRSALGRHVQNLDKYEELLGQSRALAEQLVDRLGDAPESKTARFNIEMMQALATRMMVTEAGPASFDAEEMMFLARMLKDLASAKKLDIEAIERAEARATERAKKDAAASVDRVGKERGLSAEIIQAIRANILGVKPLEAQQDAGA